MENMENMIEFISGTRTATVTFTNQKHINRIKKIHEDRKDEFKYFVENDDGSICAKNTFFCAVVSIKNCIFAN